MEKGRRVGRPSRKQLEVLQRRLDLEAPGLEQRLGNVLRILVAAGPFPQAGGPQVLVRLELILAHHLFELGDGGSDRPNRLRLPPVRISATLGHNKSYPSCY